MEDFVPVPHPLSLLLASGNSTSTALKADLLSIKNSKKYGNFYLDITDQVLNGLSNKISVRGIAEKLSEGCEQLEADLMKLVPFLTSLNIATLLKLNSLKF